MTAAPFREGLRRQLDSKRVRAKEDPQTEELVDWILQPEAKADALPAGAAQAQPKRYRLIKLGIDVHADRYVVVRQIEGGAPQPAQRFSAEQFVGWAKKQTALAEKLYTCYEAGPFGYSLHRRLTALGVTNYVVRARDWDEYGQKVKTDKRDARELVLNLDRCVSGNDKAFCVVRVPSEAEEQARSRSRQREALQREKQRLAAQGRSHGLYYGARVQGQWWVEEAWQELVVPPIVLELLEPLRRLILAVEQELQAQTKTITAAAPQELPAGLGKLTYEILEREVGNWDRFQNRRQVGSYTGMCPREDTSDQRRFQGSINKHGNPRVRTVIVEASWRLIRFQPTYKPVAKWRPILMDPRATKSKRKQIAVAIGRQFSVDWWRVRTGRCKAEDLGLTFKPAPVAVGPTPWAKVAKPTPADKP
jgi:transposase